MADIRWVVRTKEGRIVGPLATREVLDLIHQGTLSGGEMIAKFPGGKWINISKEPQFFDSILEAMQGEGPLGKPAADKAPEPKKSSSPPPPEQNFHRPGPSQRPPENPKPEGSVVVEKNPMPRSDAPPVIDLKPRKVLEKKAVEKAVKKPLVFLIAGLFIGLAALFLWDDSPPKSDKVHLILPNKGGTPMSKEEVAAGFRQSLRLFEGDTFEGYLEAQNRLVALAEGAPQNAEVKGLLCLVYKELWPFSFQDSEDLRAVHSVAQSARALNPVGLDGVVCDVVKLLNLGRYREARGLVDNALEQPSFQMAPVLYEFKSEALVGEKDFQTAIAYVQKAQQLWPAWIKPLSVTADALANLKQYKEAGDLYRKILKAHPEHKNSRISLGILEFTAFKQKDSSLELLRSALKQEGRVSPILEAKGLMVLAQIYIEKNDKKKALKYAKEAYSLNSSNPQAKELVMQLGGMEGLKGTKVKDSELVFLGDQHVRAGDFFAAQAEYRAAFEADPKNAVAAVKAAKCLWQLGQSQEAIEYLNKAIKADPKLTLAYVIQADYYSQRYNYQAAAQVLARARAISPQSHEVWRGFAQVELRRNNLPSAITLGQRALKIYDADIDTYILMAKAHLGQGDVKEAFTFAARATELDATNSEAQTTYAKVLSRFQGMDSAVSYLQDLITKYQSVIDYRMALANLYRDDEQYRNSQNVYQQIVDFDPKNKEAHIGLGISLQAQNQMDPALKSYLSAAALDPSDAEALFRAGVLYMETARYPQSIQQFERVVRLNANFPRAHFYMGKSSFLKGDHQRAIEEATVEKKLNPNLSDAYLLAAEAYAATKQYSKCAGEYQQAIKIRPQGAQIYVHLAKCYRLAGSLDVASAMLKTAMQKESGLPDIYREQGLLFEMQGESHLALEAYDKYLALSPNAVDKKEIEGRISGIDRRK